MTYSIDFDQVDEEGNVKIAHEGAACFAYITNRKLNGCCGASYDRKNELAPYANSIVFRPKSRMGGEFNLLRYCRMVALFIGNKKLLKIDPDGPSVIVTTSEINYYHFLSIVTPFRYPAEEMFTVEEFLRFAKERKPRTRRAMFECYIRACASAAIAGKIGNSGHYVGWTRRDYDLSGEPTENEIENQLKLFCDYDTFRSRIDGSGTAFLNANSIYLK